MDSIGVYQAPSLKSYLELSSSVTRAIEVT